jgi:hypothetical protein
MRGVVIVVMMLAVTTPLEASQSCMSKTEARQHFGDVHIYWHGPGHCWDGSPSRHHQIQSERRKVPVDVAEKTSDAPKPVPSNWRNSMSEMLPDANLVSTIEPQQDTPRLVNEDAAGAPPPATRSVDAVPSPLATRWVDIAQVVPQPPAIDRANEPMRSGLLVLIAIALTIGTVAIAFCVMSYERPTSTNI